MYLQLRSRFVIHGEMAMRTVTLLRNLVTAGSTLLLASCLSILEPVTVVYEAPSNAEGKRCIAQCTYAKNNCFRQCGGQAHDCRIREMQFDALNNAIKTLAEFAESEVPDKKSPGQEPANACQHTLDACAVQCKGDMFCATKCDIDYKFCSAFGGMIAGSSIGMGSAFKGMEFKKRSENVCDKRWCDDLCRDDYRACFIGCGGRTYIENNDRKSK